jgi:uncharacterized protein YhdP
MFRHLAPMRYAHSLVLWTGAVLGVVLLAGWLVIQFAVLRDVDRYRPDLVAALGRITGTRVDIGGMSRGPLGLLPSLRLDHIIVYDLQGQPSLKLDHVEGRLSLLNLFRGRIDLNQLTIDQPQLSLRRAEDGQLFLSGIPLPHNQAGPSPFLDWLFNQGEIRVNDAQVQWLDDQLKLPSVQIDHGFIRLRNRGSRHRLEADFDPPEMMSSHARVTADFKGSDTVGFSDWIGSAEVRADRVDLEALKPWVPQFAPVESAQGSLVATLSSQRPHEWNVMLGVDARNVVVRVASDLPPFHFDRLKGGVGYSFLPEGFEFSTKQLTTAGSATFHTPVPLDLHIRYTPAGGALTANQLDPALITRVLDKLPLTPEQRTHWADAGVKGKLSDVDARWQGAWDHPDDYSVKATLSDFQVNAIGPWPALHGFTGHVEASPQTGSVKGQGSGLTLALPSVFATPLTVAAYSLDAGWERHGERTDVSLIRVDVANDDLAGTVSGTFSFNSGGPGQADLTGELSRAQPAAVWRYMPLGVSADAREWLKASLLAGQGSHVTFLAKGDLNQFPFPKDRGGKFRVTADLADVTLRFNPDWPAITGIQAKFAMQGDQLTVDASEAHTLDSAIKATRAVIPDLIHGDEQLMVAGEAEGAVADALSYIQKSPVARLTNHATDGVQGEGRGHLALKLQVPLRHTVDTTVKGDYQFLDSRLDDGPAGIPPLEHVQGHLAFTEKGISAQAIAATVLAGPAQFDVTTLEGGAVQVSASGTADMAQLQGVYRQEILADVAGKEAWKGLFTFGNKQSDIHLETQATFLGDPVNATLSSLKDGSLDLALKGRIRQASIARKYPGPWIKALDSGVDWNGHVWIRGSRDEISLSAAALVLGESAYLLASGSTQGPLVADVTGHVNVASLKRLGYGAAADHASGATEWKAHVEQAGGQSRMVFTSSLAGVGIELPEPFVKSPRDTLPLSVAITPGEGGLTRVDATLGDWVGMRTLLAAQGKGVFQPRRGAINIGGPVHGPLQEGFAVTGTLRHATLDGWSKLWPDGTTGGESADSGLFGTISRVDLTVDDVLWGGRRWGRHQVHAVLEGDHWTVRSRGAEAEGDLTWQPQGAGRVKARFTRLILPPAEATGENAGTRQTHDLPAVDLVADQFNAANKSLGKLQLMALRDGPAWKIEQVSLTTPAATLEGDGRWSWGDRPHTQMNIRLKASDLGRFLSDLGYPKTVSRGKGSVNGQLDWDGDPDDFHAVSTTGHFALDLHDGQFSKVEPGGAGRLIGLLSLQELPRRITLDFRDIFSDGFAFDSVTGNVTMDHGILTTRELNMTGPSAQVLLSGTIDLSSETTRMKVKVSPAVGGSVSLATTVIGGPVAGAATYLLQKLLKNPLDKVLGYEYMIEGNWDDPKVTKEGNP